MESGGGVNPLPELLEKESRILITSRTKIDEGIDLHVLFYVGCHGVSCTVLTSSALGRVFFLYSIQNSDSIYKTS